MTTLVKNLIGAAPTIGVGLPAFTRRALVVATLVAAASLVPGGWAVALDAMSEAYLAVAVFVAGTLALVSYAERGLKIDLGVWLDRHRQWQVPVATLLGAFPGCGGAIIAVTQFTRGYLSFGAVVATLIATMGDAMFLLLASEPRTALGVLAASVAVGMVTGIVIDRVHGPDFLRPAAGESSSVTRTGPAGDPEPRSDTADRFWLALIVPGAIVGVLAAFRIEVDAFIPTGGLEVGLWLGVAGAALAMAMWAGAGESRATCQAGTATCRVERPSTLQRVIDTTNFVTAWVVLAFVGYELLVAATGIDPARLFAVWAPLVPALAILVGFIPGCGPQIVVTSLYLSGSLPLSAQIGNAIANDGDALFPAFAIAPRAAVVATLYSAVPAVIVAYGWYGWIELGVV